MSRHIDESKPLSKADREWLISRNDWARIQRIDSSNGIEAEAEPVSAPRPSAVGQRDLDRLQLFLSANFADEIHGEAATAGAEGPVDIAIRLLTTQVLNQNLPEPGPDPVTPPADGTTAEDEANAEQPQGGTTNYQVLSVAELQGLLEKRELSRSGNKAELIARLVEDDEDA